MKMEVRAKNAAKVLLCFFLLYGDSGVCSEIIPQGHASPLSERLNRSSGYGHGRGQGMPVDGKPCEPPITTPGRKVFRKGDRVAQLVIQEVPRADLVIVDELDETDRGDGGFGSTGLA